MKKIPIRHIEEPNLAGNFSIKSIENLLNESDMVQELHGHNFFYLLVVKTGSGAHEIDFINHSVDDGTLFLMRPGQVHQLTLKAGSTGYLLQFKPGFFDAQDKLTPQFLRQVSHRNFCKLPQIQFDKLDKHLTHILQEFTDQQEGYQDAIKSSLHIFFIELLRKCHANKAAIPVNNSYAQEKLEQFLELLETHLTIHKQVAEYSRLMNLSQYQLSTITKSLLDKKPSELINDTIILESKRQLLATPNQVNQIAYHLGYEDASYFIRFFKKHTGFSPETFRNNFK
ncbi:helix-turn-helix domain-containing protein [Pedobacter polaris]|uniref:Helix-turn-helix domain-containing protein n=1 Tax=Pedobacter polaris TaxID=2571273 RepID=A0A4U1CWQ3_9SPHI|nr:AraC family transcriptional regulator [Pedobacter polaris]TKC12745.1 helix-turn-helix domain-containing protein [Pedobacter polaris]